jgi:hypothetical protein
LRSQCTVHQVYLPNIQCLVILHGIVAQVDSAGLVEGTGLGLAVADFVDEGWELRIQVRLARPKHNTCVCIYISTREGRG